jgi:cytochrome c-type protein NapC
MPAARSVWRVRSWGARDLPNLPRPALWTDKIARKMQVSNMEWVDPGWKVNTRRNFLDHRLELAEHDGRG